MNRFFTSLLLLVNLYNVAAVPTSTQVSKKCCTPIDHPDVSDLVGTKYIKNVHAVKLTSSNRTYRYVHYPATRKAQKPTILFLHGFPSTSFDWRFQFEYFSQLGYGIVAPDLLGYGGTDKPIDPQEYTLKKQVTDVVEFLDCVAGTGKALVVGHDLGSPVVSRIASYHPDRFEKYIFLDVGYNAPNTLLTEEIVKASGPVLGYQIFLNEDKSGSLLDQHLDSFWSLIYTSDEPTYWTANFTPVGEFEKFLKADDKVPVEAIASAEDAGIHNQIFAASRGGYNPAINQYRAVYRNLNLEDEKSIPPSSFNLTKPTLLLTAGKDPVGSPKAAEGSTKPYAPDLQIREIDAGHFLMVEEPEKVNEAMREFLEG